MYILYIKDMISGTRAAVNHKADWYIYCVNDVQHPPLLNAASEAQAAAAVGALSKQDL